MITNSITKISFLICFVLFMHTALCTPDLQLLIVRGIFTIITFIGMVVNALLDIKS